MDENTEPKRIRLLKPDEFRKEAIAGHPQPLPEGEADEEPTEEEETRGMEPEEKRRER
jgi:hypothetical protein